MSSAPETEGRPRGFWSARDEWQRVEALRRSDVRALDAAETGAVAEAVWQFTDPALLMEALQLLVPALDAKAIEEAGNRAREQATAELTLAALVPLVSYADADQRPGLESDAWSVIAARNVDAAHSPVLSRALIALAPFASEDRADLAVEIASDLDPVSRAEVIAAFAPCFAPKRRAEVLSNALSDARSYAGASKAEALAALAEALTGQVQAAAVAESLAAATDEGEAGARLFGLERLYPLLTSDQRVEAEELYLKSVAEMEDVPEGQADALLWAAEEFPEERRQQIQAQMNAIEDAQARDRALLSLQFTGPAGEAGSADGGDDPHSGIEAGAGPGEGGEPAPDDLAGETPAATPAPERDEATPTHLDEPAQIDQLNRRPFAEVIATTIEQVRREFDEARGSGDRRPGAESAYLVHIHGPWGAGKSSVLNFLREILTDAAKRPRWIVVDFNAWRHQHVGPPWWALTQAIYRQSLEQLPFAGRLRLRRVQLAWGLRTRFGPALITAGIVAGLVSLTLSAGADMTEVVKRALEVVAVVLAAGGALMGGLRGLFMGSTAAAKRYVELSRDPMRPIVGYFTALIRAIRWPVAIFIDDLDRCESAYTVELLRGIQTLFRRGHVTYVVAADRQWLRSCYEQAYPAFGEAIGEPGRSIGYLFLEKIFQVSVPLPRLSAELQASFLEYLVRERSAGRPEEIDSEREAEEQRAAEELAREISIEEYQRRIAQSRDNPFRQRAYRVAAAKRVIMPEVRRHTEHVLQPYAPLLEANPRSMKRLVNAYGFQQAINWLAERDVPQGPLVLWTIVQMRWPVLADHLASYPAHVDPAGRPDDEDDLGDEIRRLLASPATARVINGEAPNVQAALTPDDIRRIVGADGAIPQAGLR